MGVCEPLEVVQGPMVPFRFAETHRDLNRVIGAPVGYSCFLFRGRQEGVGQRTGPYPSLPVVIHSFPVREGGREGGRGGAGWVGSDWPGTGGTGRWEGDVYLTRMYI